VIGWYRRAALRNARLNSATEEGFVEANYDVPHCQFKRTDEGFIVTFNRTSVGIHKGISSTGRQQSGLEAVASLAVLAGAGAAALAQKTGAGTTIEVTANAVIIDNKKMRRAQFGHFSVGKVWTLQGYAEPLAVLSYSYGNQSFEFGGAWFQHQATEVASSLNQHLRDAADAGDEHNPSPDLLRAARPTDF
jgi:hypothetical protein